MRGCAFTPPTAVPVSQSSEDCTVVESAGSSRSALGPDDALYPGYVVGHPGVDAGTTAVPAVLRTEGDDADHAVHAVRLCQSQLERAARISLENICD